MSNNKETFTECAVIHPDNTGIVFAVTVTYNTDTGNIVTTDFEGVLDTQ
jgi:hypothetical protein